MAKLILRYEAAVLKEVPLQKTSVMIGRTPGNDVVIDNLAVSGHHAKVIFDQDQYFVEDQSSLNGTFLNNQRIRKSPLKSGDEITIGKHTLVFRDEGTPQPPTESSMESTQPMPKMEETVVLDTKKRREFLAKSTSVASEGASQTAQEKIGCLTVLAGKADQKEYILTSKLCTIGKSDMASVKLRGWFAPAVAAVINRKEGAYSIAPSEKRGVAKVNSETLLSSRKLEEGDLIQIGGVKLQFYYRE